MDQYTELLKRVISGFCVFLALVLIISLSPTVYGFLCEHAGNNLPKFCQQGGYVPSQATVISQQLKTVDPKIYAASWEGTIEVPATTNVPSSGIGTDIRNFLRGSVITILAQMKVPLYFSFGQSRVEQVGTNHYKITLPKPEFGDPAIISTQTVKENRIFSESGERESEVIDASIEKLNQKALEAARKSPETFEKAYCNAVNGVAFALSQLSGFTYEVEYSGYENIICQ